MTRNGLRGLVTSNIFIRGVSDTNIALFTGHKQLISLKSYQRLNGLLGKLIQSALSDDSDGQANRNSTGQIERTTKIAEAPHSIILENSPPALATAIDGFVSIFKELIIRK